MADQAHEGTPVPGEGPETGATSVLDGLNDRLLDALVYLPAGLALTAAEELPKLAALGRQRLSGQVASARMVGDLAVRAGRQYVRVRSDQLLHRPPAPSSRAPVAGTSTAAHPAPASGVHDGTRAPSGGPDEGRAGAPEARSPGNPAGTGEGGPLTGHEVPAVSSLAIPGFDTLSASQVVQRLAGLSGDELLAVRAYEGAGRGRRTVLHRVDQLLFEQAS